MRGTRRIAARTYTAAWMMLCGIAFASVPPPDPYEVQAVHAVDALLPFLGSWEGDISLNGPYGQRTIHPTRKLARVGNVVAFTITEESAYYVWLNVIAYDTKTGALRMFLPGYRRTYHAETQETVPLLQPDGATLQWTVPGPLFKTDPPDSPVQLRYTVTVRGEEWRETLERIDATGAVLKLYEYTLRRTGQAKLKT